MENKLAVITGASSGIGFELARQFGSHGYDLLIASENDEIFEAQNNLEEEGFNVEAVRANLATYAGVENLVDHIQRSNKPLEAIAINAGVGVGGPFVETELREEINLINLNIVSVVHLTKRVLQIFQEEGSGKILYTSSIASHLPGPYEAVYAASKAFINSFVEAVRTEMKKTDITFTVLMPGPTNTNFFHRAHMEDTKANELKENNDPAEVARQGFEALTKGKKNIFAESMKTKLQGFASKLLPQKTRAEFHKQMSEPGSSHH